MDEVALPTTKKTTLFILYVIGLIFAFTTALPAYVNSSFLKSLTSEHAVGIFYIIGSIISLTALVFIPKILKKFGNYKVTLFVAVLFFLNFLSLAFNPNDYLVLLSFVLSGSMTTIIYFNLDIFVEHNSLDIKTGRIRSIYLTCINLAWLVSPWLAGMIVDGSYFRKVYLVVALIMIPIIIIVSSALKDFKDPEYRCVNLIETVKGLKDNKNIKNIWFSAILLQLFFSWMVIYSPMYLNTYIGFDWSTIGIILSIALIPFVLFQIPSGQIADKFLGEKELLTSGFILMGVFTATIPIIHSNNFLVWAFILLMTRVGAAIVEVMNDTYFFKNVTDQNLNLINLYRTAAPLAYIISPLIASILMFFMPLGNMFFVLGMLMLLGLSCSLAIKDSK
jgi:MFS family permease